jgi:uncharacterized protein YifN (PemK superfamily)
MAITLHPDPGTILIADFSHHKVPEITKRRPVIVISPRFRQRDGLCAVVPCSTTPPKKTQPYHYKLSVIPALPAPYDHEQMWVKADLVYTVSFDRLFLPFIGKNANGVREYDIRHVTDIDINGIRDCVRAGLGL